jgi:hypothetical protein
MSKSIIGLIVALCLSLPIRAEQPIFNVSSVADVTTGQIIDVDFHVNDFSSLISVSFTVSWDPTVLDFRAIKNLNSSVNGLEPLKFQHCQFNRPGKIHLGVAGTRNESGNYSLTVHFSSRLNSKL